MDTVKLTACRSCGESDLAGVLDLGSTPLADVLLTREMLGAKEAEAPLELRLCRRCGLAQLSVTVDRTSIYGDSYPYFSSTSRTLVEQARENVEELIATRALGRESRVVEIASNDGYLLRHFADRGINVLGVEPSIQPAERARGLGIPTLTEYFGRAVASELRDQGWDCDVVVANNVLAHVESPHDLLEGIATLLKPDGIAVIEVAYLADLLATCSFDTIYHQHLCYFSLTSLAQLFAAHSLVIQDVRRLPAYGGSLRLYAGRHGRVSGAVQTILDEEQRLQLTLPSSFEPFARSVEQIRRELPALLNELRAEGCRIAGYGAAAKATTLLACCGIGRDTIEYVVDANPFKQGRFLPGVHIPIVSPSRLIEDRPDAVVLFAWNLLDEILEQQTEYRRLGGRFIVPIPAPRMI